MDLLENQRQSTVIEYEKSQLIRAVDVITVAPIIMYAAVSFKEIPSVIRLALGVIAVSTFIYNGRNFIKNQQSNKQIL